MKFDLGHFKKINETDSHATLMHPMGHKIVVSKQSLNPRLTKQLSQLKTHNIEKNFADGGEAMSDEDVEKEESQKDLDKGYADGGEVDQNRSPASDMGVDISGGYVPMDSAQPYQPENYAITGPSPASVGMGMRGGNGSQYGDISDYQRGFGEQQRGINQEAAATGNLGKSEAEAADQYQRDVQKIMADHQTHYQSLNQEIQSTVHDIENGHVDPHHYWNEKSTAGKISTAIGLILGGIGGGLTGQENPAMKFMQSQIDRDVSAQQADLGRKNNILNAYFQQTKNMNEATAMTRGFYLDMYSNQLKKAAALSQDPMAKARALQESGKLEIQKAQTLGPLALRNSIMNNVSSGQVDPSLAARVIPDPKDKELAYKEVGKAQEVEKLRKNFQSSFDDLNSRLFAGHLSRADRNSAMQAFAGPIAKMAEGRFNLQEAQNQADALLPGIEGNETRALKQQRLNQFFDSFLSAPVMESYYGKNILKHHSFNKRMNQ